MGVAPFQFPMGSGMSCLPVPMGVGASGCTLEIRIRKRKPYPHLLLSFILVYRLDLTDNSKDVMIKHTGMDTEVPVDEKAPAVYWAEVVGENKPSLACNLTCGSDHFHVEGWIDKGADVTIIPERMWPSHWDLQHVVGKIQGLGGIKLAKISKSNVQIEEPDGKLTRVLQFVTKYKCPLWGRDTMSQWGVKLIIPKTPQDF
ncbi:endogenous retrovirus group K member 25 Pro protein-like protein [Turdus rufiventris]|nr:endogenous retrovirus group K member 25 Pro protein-like protein [Turdus rufiventris]